MAGGGRVTTPDGKARAPESARALEIRWQRVHHLTQVKRVITGVTIDAEEGEAEAAPAPEWTQPFLVLVCDDLGQDELLDSLETETFVDEKIALASRAFRCVRMTPEDAAREPMLAGAGEAHPRLVLLDPLRSTSKVLDKERELGPKPVYSAMRKVADGFFDGVKVDKLVKDHQKILAALDKLAPDIFKVGEDLSAAEEKGDEGKAKRLRSEQEKLHGERDELLEKQAQLWTDLKVAAV
ncbi:MAG: hypothetical protein AB7T63_14480 [Planctomycetota bacterium]